MNILKKISKILKIIYIITFQLLLCFICKWYFFIIIVYLIILFADYIEYRKMKNIYNNPEKCYKYFIDLINDNIK